MQGTGEFQSKGSFGIPDHMKTAMDGKRKARDHEARQAQAEHKDADPFLGEFDLRKKAGRGKPEDEPQDGPEAVEAVATSGAPEEAKKSGPPDARALREEKKKEQHRIQLELKKEYENVLGVKITSDDVHSYIFRGRITKKDVVIVPGYLNGTYRTHVPQEIEIIDQKMAAFRDKGRFTPEGLENHKALLLLSYVWMEAGGRSLGDTPEARLKTINQMGSLVADRASATWQGLNFLISYALNEKDFVKNS